MFKVLWLVGGVPVFFYDKSAASIMYDTTVDCLNNPYK
jgi:hypothetical protein